MPKTRLCNLSGHLWRYPGCSDTGRMPPALQLPTTGLVGSGFPPASRRHCKHLAQWCMLPFYLRSQVSYALTHTCALCTICITEFTVYLFHASHPNYKSCSLAYVLLYLPICYCTDLCGRSSCWRLSPPWGCHVSSMYALVCHDGTLDELSFPFPGPFLPTVVQPAGAAMRTYIFLPPILCCDAASNLSSDHSRSLPSSILCGCWSQWEVS